VQGLHVHIFLCSSLEYSIYITCNLLSFKILIEWCQNRQQIPPSLWCWLYLVYIALIFDVKIRNWPKKASLSKFEVHSSHSVEITKIKLLQFLQKKFREINAFSAKLHFYAAFTKFFLVRVKFHKLHTVQFILFSIHVCVQHLWVCTFYVTMNKEAQRAFLNKINVSKSSKRFRPSSVRSLRPFFIFRTKAVVEKFLARNFSWWRISGL